jgi:hypothetical protein
MIVKGLQNFAEDPLLEIGELARGRDGRAE